jgi:hypothetical protein
MGERIKAPFVNFTSRLTISGGGVMTLVGTAEDQAVYWFMEAIDPRPGEGPWPPVGRLQRPRYRVSPIRYGTSFYYGIRIPYGAVVRWHDRYTVNSSVTITDASKHATNIYLAPKKPPLIVYGRHYKIGEVKWGEESGLYDRVTVKVVLD